MIKPILAYYPVLRPLKMMCSGPANGSDIMCLVIQFWTNTLLKSFFLNSNTLWVKKNSFRGTETKNINFRLHSHPNKNELGVSGGPKYYGILGFGKKNQFWNCYAAQMCQNYPNGPKNQSEIKTRHDFHLLNPFPQATSRSPRGSIYEPELLKSLIG